MNDYGPLAILVVAVSILGGLALVVAWTAQKIADWKGGKDDQD